VKLSIPADQVSPYALAVGSKSATEPPASLSENLTAGRRGDRTPRPPPPPVDSVIAYRVNDAVSVSGLSRATLYRLIKEGKLRTKLVAGRRLIEPAALRELFSEAA
jgi:hypothetical protein